MGKRWASLVIHCATAGPIVLTLRDASVTLLTDRSVKKLHAMKDFFQATSPMPTKRERRKEARPGELLQAALGLFVEKGFAATKVEDVARLAGVSKGTLFLYFTSKEELFKAVVRDKIVGQLSQFDASIDTFEGPTDQLMRIFLQAWWQLAHSSKSSGVLKLMLSEGQQFPELAAFYREEVIEPACSLIQRVHARGVQRGEFGPIDPRYGPLTLLSSILFLCLWHHAPSLNPSHTSPLQPLAYLDALTDTLLGGVLLRAPTQAASHEKPL
jgi:AcrR family transcriptional regulator